MSQKPIVLTVYLSKGGVAKSTLAALLAPWLAGRGYNVVIVDLDRQGTQSAVFNLVDEAGRPGDVLARVLKREVDALTAVTWVDDFDLPRVDGVETGALGVLEGGPSTSLAIEAIKNNPLHYKVLNTLDVLREPIHSLGGHVDVVIVDMGPSDPLLSVAGLLATDYLLIPTDSSYEAMERLAHVVGEVADVQTARPDLKVAGIVPVMVQRYFGGLRAAKSVQIARQVLREAYGELILRDEAGEVEIPFDEDWRVVRWANEYLLTSPHVKGKTKLQAERFLKAVADVIFGEVEA